MYFDSRTKYIAQILCENNKNNVYTVSKCKIALNRYDDKRLAQAYDITTLARRYLPYYNRDRIPIIEAF